MHNEKVNYRSTLIACYAGYITQSIVVNLPPILFVVFMDKFGLSYEKLSFLVLLNFVTQIFVDLISIKFVDRIGYRKCIVTAHILATLGLVLLGVLPMLLPMSLTYPAIVIATFVFACGSGMIEVLLSPIVEAIPGDAKASTMALLHGFYCWGMVFVVLLTTLLLKFIGHDLWYIIPILWAIVPAVNTLNFSRVPFAPIIKDGESATPLKTLLTSGVFVAALALMTASGAAELAMAQWASVFAEKGLGVTKALGDLLGPCMFGVTMAIGRTIYGVFGKKAPLLKLMLGSSVLCVACYLLAVFSNNALLSLTGCAFCGLSVALLWPGMLSLTAAKFPNGGNPMFAILAVFGDIGCSVGPWLTGMVSGVYLNMNSSPDAESTGLKLGILAAVIFPILMLSLLPIFRDKKNIKKAEL